MSFLNRNKYNSTPLTPADTPRTARILDTIRSVDLDPTKVVLVGSAALTLYDIDVSWSGYDGVYEERPKDVDFAAAATYMQHLLTYGTSTGLPAHVHMRGENGSQSVVTINTPELPVDLITKTSTSYSKEKLERLEAAFTASIPRRTRPIEGTDIRVLTPDALHGELQKKITNLGAGADPKDRHDMARFYTKFPTKKSRRS